MENSLMKKEKIALRKKLNTDDKGWTALRKLKEIKTGSYYMSYNPFYQGGVLGFFINKKGKSNNLTKKQLLKYL